MAARKSLRDVVFEMDHLKQTHTVNNERDLEEHYTHLGDKTHVA